MKSVQLTVEGFPPIAAGAPKALILGTMPGLASLQKQQYYGHDRNAFWPIMAALFDAEHRCSYEQRKQILTGHGIALWDVLKSCRRQGSLDTSIAMASIQLNDFSAFFDRYGLVDQVFFNGGMAERVYKKYVLPDLPPSLSRLEYCRLPSTSPANASLNFKEKLEAWQVIKLHVLK